MWDKEKRNENTTESKRNLNSSWLMIIVPICIILFLISCFMLGSLLYNMATRDRYAVDMEVGTQGELELFHISYEDENGEIVVEGVTGEDVVAPGTEVTYTVRLENKDNIAIDYLLSCDAEFYNQYEVPIEIRLTDSFGNYILGSDELWVPVTDLNDLAYKGSIPTGEFASFGFSWRWIFEETPDDDTYDTFLGNLEGEEVPGVRVAFLTDSMVSAKLQGRSVLFHRHDYGCCICCILVWILLIISLILLLYNWKIHKKLQEVTEKVEEYESLFRSAASDTP